LASCIAVIENIFDSIIWLKIVSNNANIFLAFCYFPPDNSVFYEKCDIDIFQALENSICRYKYNGRIYVMGDMNSRTGERDDFIHCDEINHIIPNAPSVLNYENETRLCHRKNTDKFINNFGRKLLELCKATGL
jgi:hypothetical protein